MWRVRTRLRGQMTHLVGWQRIYAPSREDMPPHVTLFPILPFTFHRG